MADPNTFIKIHRSIEDHWLWQDKPFSKGQAWIDLLLIANYADEKKIFGDKVKVFPRGTIPRSIESLSKRWGWNRKTVKRFISALESDGMVTVNGTTHGTTVTLINYNKFQDSRPTKRTTNGQPNGQPRDNHGTQYKNTKEIKEIKNSFSAPSAEQKKFISPSLEEVIAFSSEIKSSADPQKFFDFYESTGWMSGKSQIKNWKALFKVWERNPLNAVAHKSEEIETDEWGKPIKPRWQ